MEVINGIAKFFALCSAAVFLTGVIYLGVAYWRQARTRHPDDEVDAP